MLKYNSKMTNTKNALKKSYSSKLNKMTKVHKNVLKLTFKVIYNINKDLLTKIYIKS